MPEPNKDTKRFGVDLSGTHYQYLLELTEKEILEKTNMWLASNDTREKAMLGNDNNSKRVMQKMLLEFKQKNGGLTREERELNKKNKVGVRYESRRQALKAINEEAKRLKENQDLNNDQDLDDVLNQLQANAPKIENVSKNEQQVLPHNPAQEGNNIKNNVQPVKKEQPAEKAQVKEKIKPDPYAKEKKEIENLANGILKDLKDLGIQGHDNQITDVKELCINGDSSAKGFKDRLDEFKEDLEGFKEALDDYSDARKRNESDLGSELLLGTYSIGMSKTISKYQEWALNRKIKDAKQKWQIYDPSAEKNEKSVAPEQKKSVKEKLKNFWHKVDFIGNYIKKNAEKRKSASLNNEAQNKEIEKEGNVMGKEGDQRQLHNQGEEKKQEQQDAKNLDEGKNIEQKNEDLNQENINKEVDQKEKNNVNNENQKEVVQEVENPKVENENNVQNENVQNVQDNQPEQQKDNVQKNKPAEEVIQENPAVEAPKVKVENENIKPDKKAIQEAVNNYEEKLNSNTELNSVIAENKVLKGKSEIDRSESLALTENFDALQEGETAIRKAMPIKMEGPSISVPDLIKDQMLLNDGHMSPLQKLTHYNNIIQMKDMDGDKYSKQLMDYRLKVAEEAGKEFDKKHQDPTKLSFLNKSANAIETVMCAMSRNPLGIGILLVAALNAPLLIVGLLAFTAWKRKRPNPAYQQAWKEQTQRELAAKRQELANLYGRDPRELSDREVTKALRADYVNQKVYDALDAKLERDAQKTVDSATKKYAKAISKEAGEKFRSKDLRDHAEKELMRKKHKGETLYSMPTARENRLKQAINQYESNKGMGGRSM